MSEPSECKKFRKQGGGRGKPARDAICADCGIIWTEHPRSEAPVKVKRPATFRLKPRPKNEPPKTLVASPKPESIISEPEPPAQPKRTPEEEARIQENLARLFEEHFGPDCLTVDDW